MNQGKYVFSQLLSFLPKYEFDKCVRRYKGNHRIKSFGCWSQFLCLSWGQLTHRESLRDIITCLQAKGKKVYHIGFKGSIARSTLADANESRDWRIYADFAQVLIPQAKELYLDDEEFKLDLDNSAYALDASTIDLCLSVFKWAHFRKTKAAVKLHTMIDLRGSIPTFLYITDGKTHDVKMLDQIEFEPDAVYVMDRGYLDFGRLYKLHKAGAYFVIRAKNNLKFRRQYSRPKSPEDNILYDQIGVLTVYKSRKAYPEKLRRVKTRDPETGKDIVLLTNNFTLDAKTIADLYRYRWRIELFFKWIKQHLRVKVFWGVSPNAVRTQIWVAVITYLLVAIAKKKLKIERSIYEILQIVSVSTFDKTPLNELLMNTELHFKERDTPKQLSIFDL